ncbi:hypothetical protein TPR58_02760 [Sphingomonas sp. HF-S3]|uniref:Phosphoribosyltransferase n=1 Tax=Sphingomonas rustica TaxID=3103142 RepID=A0ABV0B3B1_9SPHN
MRLYAICNYRGNSETWTEKWESSHYTARNLVKAVKGLPFNGHSIVTQGGSEYRVENTAAGRAAALHVSSRSIAKAIVDAGYEDVAIIPIPSSTCTDPALQYTGAKLADAIAALVPGFVARPVLYFAKELLKSSAGGGRNEEAIKANLRSTSLAGINAAVLIDDVYTTGAHSRAAARYLRQHGIDISDIFVIGRTVHEKPDKMLNPPSECVPDGGGLFD